MNPRLRAVLRLLSAWSAAVALLLAPLLLQAHRAHVQHVRCVEHGELVELSHADGDDEVHQDHHDPVAVPGHADSHDQHCALHGAVASSPPAGALARALLGALPEDAPVLLSAAPRGPPLLSYAPKTDPPSCA